MFRFAPGDTVDVQMCPFSPSIATDENDREEDNQRERAEPLRGYGLRHVPSMAQIRATNIGAKDQNLKDARASRNLRNSAVYP